MATDTGEDSFERASELQQARRFGEAAAIYQRLSDTRLTINVALNFGIVLGELGRRAEAEHWAGLVASHRPADPNVRRILGNAYAASGKVELAEREYRAALEPKPDDGPAQLALTGLYLSVGRCTDCLPLLA